MFAGGYDSGAENHIGPRRRGVGAVDEHPPGGSPGIGENEDGRGAALGGYRHLGRLIRGDASRATLGKAGGRYQGSRIDFGEVYQLPRIEIVSAHCLFNFLVVILYNCSANQKGAWVYRRVPIDFCCLVTNCLAVNLEKAGSRHEISGAAGYDLCEMGDAAHVENRAVAREEVHPVAIDRRIVIGEEERNK